MAKEPDEAQKLVMTVQLDKAAREMIGAARALQEHSASGERVGIIGFCIGGALALHAAAKSELFGDAIAFYPTLMRTDSSTDYGAIRGAVQCHFAEHDHATTPERIEQLRKQFTDADVDAEIFIYPGTDHAFFNDSRPQVHNPDAARQAWDRTLKHLQHRLTPT